MMIFVQQLFSTLGLEKMKLLSEKDHTQVYEGSLKGEEVIIKIHTREKYFWREFLSLNSMKNKKLLVPKLIAHQENFLTAGFGYLIWKKLRGENLLCVYNTLDEYEKKNLLYQCGYALGELNVALSSDEILLSNLWKYSDLDGIKKFDGYRWKDYFIKQIPKWVNKINRLDDLDIEFERVGALVINQLNSFKTEEIYIGLVHRDYGFRNILVQDKSIAGIIDFEHAIIGDVVFDTAKLLFNSLNFTDIDLKEQFLRGWEEKTHLRIEKDKLLLFLAIQGLGAMQWVDSQKYELTQEDIEYRKKAKKIVGYAYQELLG